MAEFRENVIEWLTGEDRVTCTFTQKRHINRVKKLARTHENEVDFEENSDGSIVAHLPLKAVKLYLLPPGGAYFFNKETEEDSEE